MTEDMVLNVGAEAIKTMILLAGPMLAAAMIVGIVVSILQAITQINEATLTFIPKMIAIIVILAVMAPWMIRVLEEYTQSVMTSSMEWIR